MRNLIIISLLAACLALPLPALAQSAPAPADPPDVLFGMNGEQLATIGAGVVVGALVLHLLVPADFTYFAGGVVGGLFANWWYDQRKQEQLRAGLRPSVYRAALKNTRPQILAIQR